MISTGKPRKNSSSRPKTTRVPTRTPYTSAGKQPLPWIHLSIKRNDREPVTDWRHKQAIKDQLVGHECEAVELYPATSRLVDCANQFHLWCCPDPTWRFPLGFTSGLTGSADDAAKWGARQRELKETG